MRGGGKEKARGCGAVSVIVPSFPLSIPFRMVLLLESTYWLSFSTSSGGASSLAGTMWNLLVAWARVFEDLLV